MVTSGSAAMVDRHSASWKQHSRPQYRTPPSTYAYPPLSRTAGARCTAALGACIRFGSIGR
eukprot:3161904-Rhodomonas_salina.2